MTGSCRHSDCRQEGGRLRRGSGCCLSGLSCISDIGCGQLKILDRQAEGTTAMEAHQKPDDPAASHTAASPTHSGAEGPEQTPRASPIVDKKLLRRAVAASAMGNAIEWFDYGIY